MHDQEFIDTKEHIAKKVDKVAAKLAKYAKLARREENNEVFLSAVMNLVVSVMEPDTMLSTGMTS